MKLKTEFTFDSAHKLNNYKGACSRVHGHQWRVIIWIEGDSSQCDNIGILWDFTNVKKLEKQLDHYYLNDILPLNPTAENISMWILNELEKEKKDLTFTVRIYESPKSYCEVSNK